MFRVNIKIQIDIEIKIPRLQIYLKFAKSNHHFVQRPSQIYKQPAQRQYSDNVT